MKETDFYCASSYLALFFKLHKPLVIGGFAFLSQEGCVLHVCVRLTHCCFSLLLCLNQRNRVTVSDPCDDIRQVWVAAYFSLPVWVTLEDSAAIFPLSRKLKIAFTLG